MHLGLDHKISSVSLASQKFVHASVAVCLSFGSAAGGVGEDSHKYGNERALTGFLAKPLNNSSDPNDLVLGWLLNF